MDVSQNENHNLKNEQSTLDLKKIDQAYASPTWWYDLRGLFILTLAYQSNLVQQVRFFNRNIKAKHLEAAIGTGTLFGLILQWRRLTGAPKRSITAFDYAEKMLEGAKKRFINAKNIELVRADIGSLEMLDSSFDSVNIANSFHCFPDYELALREVFRVLKPGGTLGLNVLLYPEGDGIFQRVATKINNWGMRKGILHTPYKTETVVRALIKSGFKICEQSVCGNSCNFLVEKPKNFNQDHFQFNRIAFSRNLGWVTENEAEQLASKKVAIAGMGGVGGSHLITLARLGVYKFHIADFDTFEVSNFNRQYGADLSTVARKKIEVMKEKLLLINPHAEVTSFENGLNENNMNSFLEGVDLFVDGLDVFEIGIRRKVFQKAYDYNIPAISVAPLGMGAAHLIILPGKMNFEQYFGFTNNEKCEVENLCRFLLGMGPSLQHISTIVDRQYADLKEKRAPSTPMGCQLASGVLGTQALKILLERKGIVCAPRSVHFDSYLGKTRPSWIPLGAKNIFFEIKLRIFMATVKKTSENSKLKKKANERRTRPFFRWLLLSLPKKIRFSLMRSQLNLPAELDSKFSFRIARTQEELSDAYRILHDSYLDLGYSKKDASGMRIVKYFALPSTTTLIALFDGKVVGTVSIIRRGAFGLPMESAFNLSEIVDRNEVVAEVSSLAIDSDFRTKRGALFLPLLKYFWEYVEGYMKLDSIVVTVNPSMVDFYEGFLAFERLNNSEVSDYGFANGNPGIGLYLNVSKARPRFASLYDHLPRSKNLYRYFVDLKLQHFEMPHREFFKSNDPVMTPQMLDYFFVKKSNVLSKLSSKELMGLSTMYPGGHYRGVLPTGFNHGDIKGARYPTNVKAVSISYTDSDIRVLDVGQSGLCVASSLQLAGVIRLQVRVSEKIVAEVRGEIRWSNTDRNLYGIQLLKTDSHWGKYVQYMKQDFEELNFDDLTKVS